MILSGALNFELNVNECLFKWLIFAVRVTCACVVAFTLSLSGTKLNDPSAVKALACFMEKTEVLSSLK